MKTIIEKLIHEIEKEKQDTLTSTHYRMTDDGYIEGLDSAIEIIKQLDETPQTVVINPIQLFQNNLDIRKYLHVDVGDSTYDEIIENDEFDHETIKEVLDLVDMFVRIDKLPKQLEVNTIGKSEMNE